MKRRNWTIEEKVEIVLEGLQGTKPVSQICRERQISQTLYYKWRDKFLEGGRKGLQGGTNNEEAAYEARIEKLEKIIGRQAVVIETLKKHHFPRRGRTCAGA